MTLDGTNRRLSVLPQTSLAPFESYRLEVSAGLEDEAAVLARPNEAVSSH